MTVIPKTTYLITLAIFCAAPGFAQSLHDNSSAIQHSNSAVPRKLPQASEPGQGAFASIAEIVQILRQDSDTDWEQVDLNRLRTHLIDMDALVTLSDVVQANIDHGVKISIDREGREGEAASRMVPAHGPVLKSETGWESQVEMNDSVITWTVTSVSEAHIIQALGFYGLMAVGNHHAPHHLALAQSKMIH